MAYLVTISLFSLVLLRLFYWQIISAERLRVEAGNQYYLELTILSRRGEIQTQDGKPLVMNQRSYLVYAQPREIDDIAKFVQEVSARLTLSLEDVYSQLSDPDRAWLPLSHKVSEEVVDKLRSLNLSGLGFEKEPRRFYPEASMAAQLLGFVGSDQNGVDTGYFGLEGYYDRELRGRDGSLRIERDAQGAPILVAPVTRIEPEDGQTVSLWLDRALQRIVEDRLKTGLTKYGAKSGSVVVMDPRTGGILALASYPNYDPGKYTEFAKEYYRNPVVADTYEPGSTFKILIMAAGLNEGVVDQKTIINETGPVRVGEYTIRTWDDQYHGLMTLSQILERSSNVGMVYIQEKLGREKMLKYLKDFGFGESTNVDLEDETFLPLRVGSEWREIDLATASFGQGIAVTPLQMVRAAGAIANGGQLMQPMLVKNFIDSRGRISPIKPKKVRQVIKPETAELVKEMMVAAVDHGEAKWAKPVGYRIAGKTGTAQIAVAGHYDEKKTIASFVGFAPADDPEFVMLVTLREPSSSQWGSETAAPLFFTIARDIFNYKNIPAR